MPEVNPVWQEQLHGKSTLAARSLRPSSRAIVHDSVTIDPRVHL
jgi:hypothetical protein